MTEALRPSIGLSEEDCERARRLRRRKRMSTSEIATKLGASEESVDLALASMRTKNLSRSRGTLNVALESYGFVLSHRLNGEPIWQTVSRLLWELAQLRAENLVLKARVGATTPST